MTTCYPPEAGINDTYDNLYQIVNVVYTNAASPPGEPNETYDYDKLGNREAVTTGTDTVDYASNQLNQYTAVDSVSLTYDDNGNLTDDGIHQYVYDSENRLTDVNDDIGNPVVSYDYDYAGKRTSKTLADGSRMYYCYDLSKAGHVLAEYEEDSLNQYYVYGPGIDDPICLIKPNGDIYYYHVDGLGSVIALSDDVGEVAEEYAYDVFGEPNRVSNVGNHYLFTARRYDQESGMYYYRARMYHPNLGRFLQTDPIGYEDEMNLYGYVSNNPVNRIDPLGLVSPEFIRRRAEEARRRRAARIRECEDGGGTWGERYDCPSSVCHRTGPRDFCMLVGGSGGTGLGVRAGGIAGGVVGAIIGGAVGWIVGDAFCSEEICCP